jgi:hypothetical protein
MQRSWLLTSEGNADRERARGGQVSIHKQPQTEEALV